MLRPHLLEERGAVPFPVEDDHEAVTVGIGRQFLGGRLTWHILEQSRHDVALEGLEHAVVDRPFHDEKRLADGIIHPIVRGAAQAQPLASHVTSRQLGLLSVIESHVPIYVQRPGQIGSGLQPLA